VLIGYYENCQVSIDGLSLNYETLNGQQNTDIKFTLSGIDENCPDLEGTVWLETPEGHVYKTVAHADTMTVALTPADINNGDFVYSFNSNEFTGDYFAHVSISPFGFECAMAIDEQC